MPLTDKQRDDLREVVHQCRRELLRAEPRRGAAVGGAGRVDHAAHRRHVRQVHARRGEDARRREFRVATGCNVGSAVARFLLRGNETAARQ